MLSRAPSLWIFAVALFQSVMTEDTVSSGQYLIHMCNSGQPNSEALELQRLLPQVYNGLQRVIADLKLGSASLHGYSAFFKDNSSQAEVLRVYESIAAGNSVTRSGNSHTLRRPTFICANNTPGTDLLYRFCTVHPDTALMTWVRTDLMPLCPLFWKVKSRVIQPDCPLVVANTLTPNDHRLLENQEALLVGEMVHLYHDVNQPFITRITDASDLNISQSLLNPPNYAFYYAAVQAGCLSFPNMAKPHDELRHLLEVPTKPSDTNVREPLYAELPSSMPISPGLDTMQNFCNNAVYAPNATVCCDESTGLWVPAPVIRDGPAASSVSASCPANTGGTGGVGAGSGVINTRRRRMTNAQ